MHQATKFFDWLSGKRYSKRQDVHSASSRDEIFELDKSPICARRAESEDEVCLDGYQRHELGVNHETHRSELLANATTTVQEVPTENFLRHQSRIFEVEGLELPGSVQLSSKGIPNATTTVQEVPIESFLRPQSRIAEVYGGDLSRETYGPSMLPPELPESVSRRRRSALEHLHPTNSGYGRHSLLQRFHKVPAVDDRRSGTEQGRDDWPSTDNAKNSLSSSSREPGKPNGSLHVALDDGDEMTFSNASSEGLICLDELSDRGQFWSSGLPLSYTVNPDISPPTADSAVSNLISPSSQKPGFTSLPSDMLTPVSPMAKHVHSPSIRNASGSRTIEHREELTDGWSHLDPPPLQWTPKERNSARLAVPSHKPIPRPVSDGTESVVSNAQQMKDSLSESSLLPVNRQYRFEELNAPFMSSQPHHSRQLTTDFESSIHSSHFDVSSEPNTSSPTVTSIATQFDTSQSENSDILPSLSASAYLSSQTEDDIPSLRQRQSHLPGIIQPLPLTRAATAFPASPLFQSSVSKPMDIGISNTWETEMERSWEALSTKTLLPCFNHRPFVVSNEAPKQVQVEELHELFRIVNNQWMQMMTASSKLWLRCNGLLEPVSFERAVRTLKEFISGIFAQTFEDVLSLVQLAFAAAFFLYGHRDLHLWKNLCHDALHWQHALASNEDKNLFLDAMSLWRLPELGLSQQLQSNNISPGNIILQESTCRSDQITLYDKLRSTEVFKVFVRFLEGKSTYFDWRLTMIV